MMAQLWLLCTAALFYTWTARAEDSADEGKGILFNWKKTILLAERFEPVEFVVPLPEYSGGAAAEIQHAAEMLQALWNQPTYDCDLTGTDAMEDNRTSKIVAEVTRAHVAAMSDAAALRIELADLLRSPTDPHAEIRQKRFVPLVIAGAAASILSMGLGVAASESCLLAGIFGSCAKKDIEVNKHNIDRALEQIHRQGERWTQVVTELNEKFYLVATELAEVQKAQSALQEQQELMWNETASALEKLAENTRMLRQCEEYLFIREQANHIRTTVLAELGQLYSNIKAFRTALWAYRATLLAAIGPLSNGKLPMALVDKAALEGILKAVGADLLQGDERLSLAIPLNNPLAYYEAALVQSVATEDAGLVMRLAIPLTTRELVLDVYEGITLPMPLADGTTATQWKIEAPLIAISKSHKENALMEWRHLEECVGTSTLAICKHGFATTRTRDSCMATLFYHGETAAATACGITTLELPRTEHAKNLGHGRWLITSRDPNFEFQVLRRKGAHREMEHVAGCRACIITLECGTEMETDRIFLKADGDSCETTGATRLNLTLADPLAAIFNLITHRRRPPPIPLPHPSASALSGRNPAIAHAPTCAHPNHSRAPPTNCRSNRRRFSNRRAEVLVTETHVRRLARVSDCGGRILLPLSRAAGPRMVLLVPMGTPPRARDATRAAISTFLHRVASAQGTNARRCFPQNGAPHPTWTLPHPSHPHPTKNRRGAAGRTSVNGRVLGADRVVALGRASARPAEHARFTRTGMSPSLCALPRLEETQP